LGRRLWPAGTSPLDIFSAENENGIVLDAECGSPAMTIRRLAAILAADLAGFSAMMECDEEGTYARVNALRREVIEPEVQKHHGRLVKTTGDGFIAEFASPAEALRSALAIQHEIDSREKAGSEPERLMLRIGINLGDIIVEEDGDVYGDDVNIASRLEQMADAGGILISGKIHEEVDGKLDCGFEDRGKQRFKNIARPVHVYAVRTAAKDRPVRRRPSWSLKQEISFCREPDGVRLAWAKVGQGPPLVKAANWLNHLEYDWESPVWHHVLEGLAHDYTLIRYDARGNGLSDWDVEEVSFDAFVRDLETVVDAAGLDRFPLLGISQGCAVSIAYAVRHPERVSHLILYGGFALGGNKRSPEEREKRTAMGTLMRLGWGADDPTFRQLFTLQFIPEGTKEQIASFNELQRRTTSPECAARYFQVVGDFDVRELLPRVTTPTLVMHVRGDLLQPIDAGRQVAAGIPGARFVAFPGRNHLFLEGEPASDRFFEEVRLFLRRERSV
jgi:class 3 adenylate cyclase/pimeloyl-ACP methyl ester carboxylesterase